MRDCRDISWYGIYPCEAQFIQFNNLACYKMNGVFKIYPFLPSYANHSKHLFFFVIFASIIYYHIRS